MVATITVDDSSPDIALVEVGSQGPSGPSGTEDVVVITSGSTYDVTATPGTTLNLIVRKTVGGPTQINLPAPDPVSPKRRVNVKDGTGDCATNTITVACAAGIDGQPTFVMSINYDGYSFFDDGTVWNVQG